MEQDSRFRPSRGGEEAGGERRRRRVPGAGIGQTQTSLLLALLLVAAAAVGFHIAPTHSTLTMKLRGMQQQPQRQLKSPSMHNGDSGGGDGSLFGSKAAGDEVAGSTWQQQQTSSGSREQPPDGAFQERTLSFDVCSDFATQRVALVSGMVLTKELNRTLVLPQLLLDGRQSGNKRTGFVDFGEMFDLPAFTEGMQLLGLRIATKAPSAAESTAVHLSKQYNYMSALLEDYAREQHIKLDCPSFRLPPDLFAKHDQLVFAALDALQPVPRLADLVSRIQERLGDMVATRTFSMLYLNTGDDWLTHCGRWERLTNGLARDNSMNNTDTVGEALDLHRFDKKVPLMLATGGTQGDRKSVV